jgi:hypothetical protein
MQKTKIDGLGVWVLMSHLIITIAILGLYAYMLHTGKGDDETIKTILTIIVGYWFGSIGANAIRPSTQIQAQEVKVQREDATYNKENGVQ